MNSSLLYLTTQVFRLLPETRCFGFKRKLLKFAGAQIGYGTRICSSARIIGSGKLTIGNNVWIGPQVLISCGGEIIIGDNVDIAPKVYIGTGSHIPTQDKDKAAGEGYNGKIYIGTGTWLCVSSIILPGKNAEEIRSIGSNCIIGAGATVVSNIKDGAIAVGIPAKEK